MGAQGGSDRAAIAGPRQTRRALQAASRKARMGRGQPQARPGRLRRRICARGSQSRGSRRIVRRRQGRAGSTSSSAGRRKGTNRSGSACWTKTSSTAPLRPTTPSFATRSQPAALRIIGDFMHDLPQLSDVVLTLSQPTPNQALSFSQLWHLDHDDKRVCKLFIYLTDVQNTADGPFTFIPPVRRSRSATRSRAT